MSRWCLVTAILVFLAQGSTAQREQATISNATVIGLFGPVHTVLTEYFDYRDHPGGRVTMSTFAVFDNQGFTLEEFRYEADGSVHSHISYTRNRWQVFKEETTSIVPSESHTFVQHFNTDGLVTGTENYDGSGVLVSQTRNVFPPQQTDRTISNSQEIHSNGQVSTAQTVEQTDLTTGITRQTITRDGKTDSDWLIQRDSSGQVRTDALKFADGSFNERDQKPDGTTLEHKYWAPTKTHTYQLTDQRNNVLGIIDESPNSYVKVLYGYDKAGRQIKLSNYDISGKLLRETITEYKEDEKDNWIEQKVWYWAAASGPKRVQLVSVNRRKITYY